MNKPRLVVFFWMVFSLYLLPQDFIPSSVMLLDSGGQIEGIGTLNREKLMQYHIDAIKKNGISKEIHKKNGKVINNYYYSSDGLLTKSEEYDSYLKSWSLAQFVYNEKNLLVSSKLVLREMSYLIEYLRDSVERIESLKTENFQIRYIYTNGILQKAGPYEKKPKEPLYEGGGWTYSFDPYGRGNGGGEGDVDWYVTFNKLGKLATIGWLFYGMASLTEVVNTITYKNDLMNKFTEVETTKITDWIYAKRNKIKPGYKKTITTITYEYGYKKKK